MMYNVKIPLVFCKELAKICKKAKRETLQNIFINDNGKMIVIAASDGAILGAIHAPISTGEEWEMVLSAADVEKLAKTKCEYLAFEGDQLKEHKRKLDCGLIANGEVQAIFQVENYEYPQIKALKYCREFESAAPEYHILDSALLEKMAHLLKTIGCDKPRWQFCQNGVKIAGDFEGYGARWLFSGIVMGCKK